MLGSNIIDCTLNNTLIMESNLKYINLASTNIENTKFFNSNIEYSTFNEVKFSKALFDNVVLDNMRCYNTYFKDIDLSNCSIININIDLKCLKGAIINTVQVLDLVNLLGVIVKE